MIYDKVILPIDYIYNIYPKDICDLIYKHINHLLTINNDYNTIKEYLFQCKLTSNIKEIIWRYILITCIKNKNIDLYKSIILDNVVGIDKIIYYFIFRYGSIDMIDFIIQEIPILSKINFNERINFILTYNNEYGKLDSAITSNLHYNLIYKYSRFFKKWIREGLSTDEIIDKVQYLLFKPSTEILEEKRKESKSYNIIFNTIYNNDILYELLYYRDYETFEETIEYMKLSLYQKYVLYSFFKELCDLHVSDNYQNLILRYSIDYLLNNDDKVINFAFERHQQLLLDYLSYDKIINYIIYTRNEYLAERYIKNYKYHIIACTNKEELTPKFIEKIEELEFEDIKWIMSIIYKDRILFYFYFNFINPVKYPIQFLILMDYIDIDYIFKCNSAMITKVVYHLMRNKDYNTINYYIKKGLRKCHLKEWYFDKYRFEDIKIVEENVDFFLEHNNSILTNEHFIPKDIYPSFIDLYWNKLDTIYLCNFMLNCQGRWLNNVVIFVNNMIDRCINEDKELLLIHFLTTIFIRFETGKLISKTDETYCPTKENMDEILNYITNNEKISYIKNILDNVIEIVNK